MWMLGHPDALHKYTTRTSSSIHADTVLLTPNAPRCKHAAHHHHLVQPAAPCTTLQRMWHPKAHIHSVPATIQQAGNLRQRMHQLAGIMCAMRHQFCVAYMPHAACNALTTHHWTLQSFGAVATPTPQRTIPQHSKIRRHHLLPAMSYSLQNDTPLGHAHTRAYIRPTGHVVKACTRTTQVGKQSHTIPLPPLYGSRLAG